MLQKFKNSKIFKYINQLIFRFDDDNLTGTSAEITYYLVLSFFPFLLFVINILSFTSLSTDLLLTNFNTFLPGETAVWLKNILTQTVQAKSTFLIIVGMLATLWSASKGIKAIMRGVNKAYDSNEKRGFIKLQGIALLSAIVLSLLIVTALFLLVFGEVIGEYIFSLIGAEGVFPMIWSVLRYGIPILIMFISLSLLYKVLPNHKLKFKEVRLVAIFTTVAWITVSYLFSFYVNNFANFDRIYGSIGGIIALLIWLYISTIIILIGGELNAIYVYVKNKKPIDKYDNAQLEIFERFGMYKK